MTAIYCVTVRPSTEAKESERSTEEILREFAEEHYSEDYDEVIKMQYNDWRGEQYEIHIGGYTHDNLPSILWDADESDLIDHAIVMETNDTANSGYIAYVEDGEVVEEHGKEGCRGSDIIDELKYSPARPDY